MLNHKGRPALDHLPALWASGLKVAVIAKRLGVTPRTVHAYRRRLGLPSRRARSWRGRYGQMRDRHRRRAFVRLWEAGTPYRELCRRFGVEWQTIWTWRKRLGLQPRPAGNRRSPQGAAS